MSLLLTIQIVSIRKNGSVIVGTSSSTIRDDEFVELLNGKRT